jgi:hypothetical protein
MLKNSPTTTIYTTTHCHSKRTKPKEHRFTATPEHGNQQHARRSARTILVSKQREKRLCSSTIWRTNCRFRTGPIKHNMKNLASSLVNSYVLITSNNLRSTQSKRPMQILQIKTMLLNQQIVESSWLHLKIRERMAKTRAHGGHVSKTNEGRCIWRSTLLLFLPYRIYTGFSLSRSSFSILSPRRRRLGQASGACFRARAP